jgi:hypothetical protein
MGVGAVEAMSCAFTFDIQITVRQNAHSKTIELWL